MLTQVMHAMNEAKKQRRARDVACTSKAEPVLACQAGDKQVLTRKTKALLSNRNMLTSFFSPCYTYTSVQAKHVDQFCSTSQSPERLTLDFLLRNGDHLPWEISMFPDFNHLLGKLVRCVMPFSEVKREEQLVARRNCLVFHGGFRTAHNPPVAARSFL